MAVMETVIMDLAVTEITVIVHTVIMVMNQVTQVMEALMGTTSMKPHQGL